MRLTSLTPVTATVRSSSAAVEARERLEGAPMASIEMAPPSAVSRVMPPVPALTSIPPAPVVAVRTMASETVSVEEIFTDEPVAEMSMSSPGAAPVARMSIPPADAVIARASGAVPEEDSRSVESVAPVSSIVKSSPSVPEVRVKSMSSTASKSNPPAVASMSSPAAAPVARDIDTAGGGDDSDRVGG